jgi:hypothetical protein
VKVDPGPFLSTIILASAGLVAIVGGLLVARFVGLDSDQRTSREVLEEARSRLAGARQRARDARITRLDWHAGRFFGGDVRRAISRGMSDPAVLIRLGDDWPFTEQELRPYVSELAAEFVNARKTLSQRGASMDSPRTDTARTRLAVTGSHPLPSDRMRSVLTGIGTKRNRQLCGTWGQSLAKRARY